MGKTPLSTTRARVSRGLEKHSLRFNYAAEKPTRIYPLRRVMRAGVNTARCGKLCAEIARVRLVCSRLFLFNLDFRRRTGLRRFHLRSDFFHHFDRMHVDVSIRAKLGAFSAADTPVFDQDFKIFFAPNGTDWALGHAKRIATRTTGSGNQVMIVAQPVPQEAGHAVMSIRASPHTSVAPGAVVEIDQEKILRFK